MDKFKFNKLTQCMCQLSVFVNGCKFNILAQYMCVFVRKCKVNKLKINSTFVQCYGKKHLSL